MADGSTPAPAAEPTATTPPPAAPPSDGAAPTTKAPRKTAPLNPDARAKKAARQAARKLLSKIEDADSPDALFAKLDELRGVPPKKDGEKQPEKPETQKLEPGQRDGWPAPSQIGAYIGTATQIWAPILGSLNQYVPEYAPQPTIARVQLPQADGQVLEQDIEITPLTALVNATAPVLAKHVPNLITTPEGAMVLTVAMVFGPSLLKAAKDFGVPLVFDLLNGGGSDSGKDGAK